MKFRTEMIGDAKNYTYTATNVEKLHFHTKSLATLIKCSNTVCKLKSRSL